MSIADIIRNIEKKREHNKKGADHCWLEGRYYESQKLRGIERGLEIALEIIEEAEQ